MKNAATTAENSTWCNDCGAPMGEGQECEAYKALLQKRDSLREILQAAGLTLKAKGPNVLVVDTAGHEVHL